MATPYPFTGYTGYTYTGTTGYYSYTLNLATKANGINSTGSTITPIYTSAYFNTIRSVGPTGTTFTGNVAVGGNLSCISMTGPNVRNTTGVFTNLTTPLISGNNNSFTTMSANKVNATIVQYPDGTVDTTSNLGTTTNTNYFPPITVNGGVKTGSVTFSDGTIATTANPPLNYSTFGTRWLTVPAVNGAPINTNWVSVAMSSTGQYQTAVVSGGGGRIYTSLNDGANWALVPTANGAPSANWWSVAMSSTGQYQTAVVYGGGIYTSVDSGANWALVPPAAGAPTAVQWYGVAMSSTGQYQTAVVYAGGIYRSIDSGANWALVPAANGAPTNVRWYSVAMSSTGQYQTAAVVNGGGGIGGIYTSSNYGANWVLVPTENGAPTNVSWSAVTMSSTGQYQTATVFAGGIYRSLNYGANWALVPTANGAPNVDWSRVAMSSTGQYQTASVYTGGLYTSSNSGANWALVPAENGAPTNIIWYSVTISSTGQYQTAVVNNGAIYTSVINYGPTAVTALGNSKTFILPHPLHDSRYLVHACLEGPEAAVYYRGKGTITDGDSTEILLPDYVDSLATDFTVSLTPIGRDNRVVYGASEVEHGRFTVYGPNGSFFWMVYGKRESITVEPYQKDVVKHGDGPYSYEAGSRARATD